MLTFLILLVVAFLAVRHWRTTLRLLLSVVAVIGVLWYVAVFLFFVARG